MPLPSEWARRREVSRADRENRAPTVDNGDLYGAGRGEEYVAELLSGEPPDGYRRGRCGTCGTGVALATTSHPTDRSGPAYWSAMPIRCGACASGL